MFEDRDRLATTDARDVALACLEAGIAAGQPRTVVRDSMDVEGSTLHVADATYDLADFERVIVLGGGNAAAHVANALEAVLGDRIDDGFVVTDDPAETTTVSVRRGDHPIPSERDVAATRDLLEKAAAADADTLVLAVVTGGGSALLSAPRDGVSLADLRTLTEALLESGAAIDEINAVRKHLSTSKGGGLAARAAPARVVSLVLSDVVGDDPGVVASGPTAPDETTFGDALAVLERYDVDTPAAVERLLERGAAGEARETPGPDDPVFERVANHVIADGTRVLKAARTVASERGYEPLVLSSRVRGEAGEAALSHVAIAEEAQATGLPVDPPAVVLSGGETTVSVRGDGTGGPNQEFATAAALELDGGITVAAVDTDGFDGPTAFAGALVDETTLDDAAAARSALASNDVTPYLGDREALLRTGPTGTNLNDLRVLVVARDDDRVTT